VFGQISVARGGVFRQKITDAERILATILALRQVCTMQALADLFDVSRRTIGNALAEVRPLLEEDGFRLPPAPSTLHSAADLLASITPQDDAPTDPKPPR
jgi:hypothetical protein